MSSRKALAVPELLLIILSNMSRRDRVSMAQVCRYFWTVAVGLIWDEVPDVRVQTPRHPICCIIPEELKYDGSIIPRPWAPVSFLLRVLVTTSDLNSQIYLPDISSTPWDRFRQHAELVRDFSMTLSSDHSSLGYLIWALASTGMKPLFPGLRSLGITASASGLAPRVMACLTSPMIRHINLKFDGMHAPMDARAVIDVVAMIQALELKSAFIKVTNRSLIRPQITQAVADAIRSQSRLESLSILGMTPQAIEFFAASSSLEYLKVLSFTEWPNTSPLAPPGDIAPAIHEGINTFPSLKSVCMSLSRAILPAALTSITSKKLGYARLRLREPARPGPYYLEGCLSGLRRFKLLTTIALTFPRTASTWEDFECLLVCSRLKIFKLEGRSLSQVIGDKELESMARSWPLLEVLAIDDFSRRPLARTSEADEGEPPRITLPGLVCLAVHCPALRKLRVSIDARIVPDTCKISATGQKVEEVSFPLSRVASEGTEARSIASFISRLWPNQRLPTPRVTKGTEGPWADVQIRHARWSQGTWERPIWERIWMMVYIYLSRRSALEL